MESNKRSLYKTITWPLVHFTFVAGILYFASKYFTGEAHWEYVGLYGLAYLSLEMTFFFLHEKAWSKLGGKVK
jgi:uncharacterized membrane protein